MPPQAGPFVVKGLLAVRASLLAEDGTPLCALDDGSAWTPCPISLATARQATADSTTELKCGDGTVADQETIQGVVTGDQITLVIAKQDFETISLLTGSDPIFAPLDPTRVIGFQDPQVDEQAPPVEFNAWARNRSNNAPAGSPYQYLRLTWPFAKFRLGDDSVGADYLQQTLIGLATPNNNIGGGVWDDFPVNANGRYRLRWATSFVPLASATPYSLSPSGGYLDTPACLS